MPRPRLLIALVFTLLLFITGYFSGKLTTIPLQFRNINRFSPSQSAIPTIEYLSPSLSPVNHQTETLLQSVYQLLKDNISLEPHYLFYRIDNLKVFCNNNPNCLNERLYLKSPQGIFYTSPNGRQEAVQSVREICAKKISGNNQNQWWSFITHINQNCSLNNIDTCWEDQGKRAGLDTTKIVECFNTMAFDLIEQELAYSDTRGYSDNIYLTINHTPFPPSSGKSIINQQLVNQADYTSPNTVKLAICAAFKHQPAECNSNP